MREAMLGVGGMQGYLFSGVCVSHAIRYAWGWRHARVPRNSCEGPREEGEEAAPWVAKEAAPWVAPFVAPWVALMRWLKGRIEDGD